MSEVKQDQPVADAKALEVQRLNEEIMDGVPIFELLKKREQIDVYLKFSASSQGYAEQSEYFAGLRGILLEEADKELEAKEREIVNFTIYDTKFFCGTIVDSDAAVLKHLDALLPHIKEADAKKHLEAIKSFCAIKEGDVCSKVQFGKCRVALEYLLDHLIHVYPQYHEILFDILLYVSSSLRLTLQSNE